jgi:hypothetical protein
VNKIKSIINNNLERNWNKVVRVRVVVAVVVRVKVRVIQKDCRYLKIRLLQKQMKILCHFIILRVEIYKI